MIPCFICKKDSTGGFTYGLPTSPSSMYVGLCPEHNTLENKKAAILHWIETTQASITFLNDANMSRHPESAEFDITVYYTAGGVMTVRGLRWDVSDGATLQISTKEKGATFIPLVHIERFGVMPVTAPDVYSSPSDSTKTYAIVDGAPQEMRK
ncbi:MAG: hypothetical protein MI749_20850 [Desulfovibrionales bacterium]|nr:hypothetical protein [Desulfovibrionales bacterium]